MTELDLYKFITDNVIEWNRLDNNGKPDVIIFPLIYQIEEFANLVKGYTGDGGIECRLMDGYFAFWMQDICDYYGIEINNVF